MQTVGGATLGNTVETAPGGQRDPGLVGGFLARPDGGGLHSEKGWIAEVEEELHSCFIPSTMQGLSNSSDRDWTDREHKVQEEPRSSCTTGTEVYSLGQHGWPSCAGKSLQSV